MPNWVCNEFNTLRLVEATFWNRLVWLINMYSNYSRCFSWPCLQIIHLVSVLPIPNWQIASLMEAQMVSDIVVALFCRCPRPSRIPVFPISWKISPLQVWLSFSAVHFSCQPLSGSGASIKNIWYGLYFMDIPDSRGCACRDAALVAQHLDNQPDLAASKLHINQWNV